MDISSIDDLRTLHELFTAGAEGRLATLGSGGADTPESGPERREAAVQLLEGRLRQAEEARDAALGQVDEEKEAALRRYDDARAEMESRFAAEVDRYRQMLSELGSAPPAAPAAGEGGGSGKEGGGGKKRRGRKA